MGSQLFVQLRRYQNDLLNQFQKQFEAGEKKFHFVAPPGSGKTLMGLEMALRLKIPFVVFSPTLAIQAQWLEMARQWAPDLDCHSDPTSGATFLSLTYQSISVKTNAGQLHQNSQAILETLKNHPVIILDECHHLTREWAKILSNLVEDSPPDLFFLIGLTATLPMDKGAQAQEVYQQLLGEVTLEVPLPPVIKEGYLSPFQDLVYLVAPSDHELEIIHDKMSSYRNLIIELTSTKDLQPLHLWAEERLENYRSSKGTPWTYNEFLKAKELLCIACVRFLLKRGMPLPLSVLLVPSMEQPLTFLDMVQVIEDYAIHCLKPNKTEEAKTLFDQIQQSMLNLGYTLGSRSLTRTGETIQHLLSRSQSKIHALAPILSKEMQMQGNDLRALILCDTENTNEGEGTSAIEVLKYLTQNPNTDLINPILLTGKTVLVDDDILPLFLENARNFIQVRNLTIELTYQLHQGVYEIGSSNSAWSTQVYVPFITELLERGVTQCLVSTKAMLGEGWNSIRLNTLVDLTVATSFAYVNQMRGRTLRLDPDRPLKTANNWDLVTIIPDEEHGSGDIERLKKKYNRFFGINSQGFLEKGMGHLHPLLANQHPNQLYSQRESINSHMLDRCQNRLETYKLWGVGKPYKNTLQYSLILKPELEMGPWALQGFVEEHYPKLLKFNKNFFFILYTLWIGGVSLIALLWENLANRLNPILLVGGIGLLTLIKAFHKAMQIKLYILGKKRKSLEVLKSLMSIVTEACYLSGLISEKPQNCSWSVDSDLEGALTVKVEPEEYAQILLQNLKELLMPTWNQKYLLLTQAFGTSKGMKEIWKLYQKAGSPSAKLKRLKNLPTESWIFPVPSAFSDEKRNAEIFQKTWKIHFGDADLVSSRSKEYPQILKSNFRKAALPHCIIYKELWI